MSNVTESCPWVLNCRGNSVLFPITSLMKETTPDSTMHKIAFCTCKTETRLYSVCHSLRAFTYSQPSSIDQNFHHLPCSCHCQQIPQLISIEKFYFENYFKTRICVKNERMNERKGKTKAPPEELQELGK